MAQTADQLQIEITADYAKVIKGFGAVSKSATKLSKNISTSFLNVGKTVGAATIKVGGMATAVTGLVATYATLSKATTEIDKIMGTSGWAKTLGIGIERFQEMSFVSKQFGVETDRLGDAMKDLNERIADAALDGTQTYEDALRKLNLTSKELINLPMEEQFLKVTDALGKLNTQSEKNFVTAELMADAGFEWIKVADQGTDKLREMMKEAKELGVVLDATEIRGLEKAGAEMSKLSDTFDAVFQKLMSKMAPAFVATSQVMLDMVKNAGGVDGVISIITDKLSDYAKQAIRFFNKVGEAVIKVKIGIKAMEITLEDLSNKTSEFVMAIQGTTPALEKQKAVLEEIRLEREKMSKLDPFWKPEDAEAMAEAEKRIEALNEKLNGVRSGEDSGDSQIKKMESELVDLFTSLDEMQSAGSGNGDDEEMSSLLKSIVGESPIEKLEEIMESVKEKMAEFNEEMLEAEEENIEKKIEQNDRELSQKEKRFEDFKKKRLDAEKALQEQSEFLWRMGAKGRLDVAENFFGQMAVLMDTNSKTQFEIGKAAAIAETVINTYKAATGAYSAMASIPYVGPVLGAVAAGAAVAAGVANVQKIKSTSFGGGGGGATAGAAPSGGGSAPSSIGGGGGGSAESAAAPRNTFFNIGLSSEAGIYSEDQVRGLIGAINDQTDDDVKLRVSS